jgi:hypothetical protein
MLAFLAAWAEITNQPKSKQITFHRGDFMYHGFLLTALLAPKESNINKYLTGRQYVSLGLLLLIKERIFCNAGVNPGVNHTKLFLRKALVIQVIPTLNIRIKRYYNILIILCHTFLLAKVSSWNESIPRYVMISKTLPCLAIDTVA